MDGILGVRKLNATKYGVVYVDLDGNQSGNNTLYNAFMNEAFVGGYWNNEEVQSKLKSLAIDLYADVEDGSNDSTYAGINAYWNLLPDNTDYYYNGGASLTRGEAMSLVARAVTPVSESGKPETDSEFEKAVGNSDYAGYANYVKGSSYLGLEGKNLNKQTFKGTMTRGEYTYLVMSEIFGKESIQGETGEVSLSDCKNGGDIAKEQKYSGDYADFYELNYAIQHSDKGAPDRLYKAVSAAVEKGIIESETRWDEAVTKTEAIEILINAFNAYTKEKGYRTNSLGETAGEQMRETARGVYQTIASQITADENTYVNEYVRMIDEGKGKEEVESALLERFKKREEETTTAPVKERTIRLVGQGEGYFEINGLKMWADSEGWVYEEDKVTPIDPEEFHEAVNKGPIKETQSPSEPEATTATPPVEKPTRSPEEESRYQEQQSIANSLRNKGTTGEKLTDPTGEIIH